MSYYDPNMSLNQPWLNNAKVPKANYPETMYSPQPYTGVANLFAVQRRPQMAFRLGLCTKWIIAITSILLFLGILGLVLGLIPFYTTKTLSTGFPTTTSTKANNPTTTINSTAASTTRAANETTRRLNGTLQFGNLKNQEKSSLKLKTFDAGKSPAAVLKSLKQNDQKEEVILNQHIEIKNANEMPPPPPPRRPDSAVIKDDFDFEPVDVSRNENNSPSRFQTQQNQQQLPPIPLIQPQLQMPMQPQQLFPPQQQQQQPLPIQFQQPINNAF